MNDVIDELLLLFIFLLVASFYMLFEMRMIVLDAVVLTVVVDDL